MKDSIFTFKNEISFLKNYLKYQEQRGHGLMRKWATELNIHTTLMSQIMSERRLLTEEQALQMALILKLPVLEREYFLLLVRWRRASSVALKKYYEEKIVEIKKRSEKVSERVQTDLQLSEEERARYYSSWMYSAVRICCSLGDGKAEGQTFEQLLDKTQISSKDLTAIIEFLSEAKLIVHDKGRWKIGAKFTHLPKESVFVSRHHTNWRLMACERSTVLKDSELMYTAPFSISQKDFAVLREKCMVFIQEFLSTVRETDAERLACFNIDLFLVRPQDD